jgi:signal transduction histidine kinase
MYTLFFNIINNAVKFSKKADPPKVEITTFSSNGHFAIMVKDHGPGMSPEQAKMIFERFRKGKSEDGYGLGLAISKTIADFHQINIKVESSQGEGTSFILIFPESL